LAGTLWCNYAYNTEEVTCIFSNSRVIFIVDYTKFQELRRTELMISYRALSRL